MSLSETYTTIGDAIRRQYGTTDKYSLGDMPKMIDYLKVRNLLDEGQFYDSSIDTVNEKKLNGLNLSDWEKLTGMTVILSFDVIWSGYDLSKESSHRTGFEYGIKFKNSSELWAGAWLYPNTESGKEHISCSVTLTNDEITDIEEGSYYNQLNGEAVVKATNIKIVVNPMGGIVQASLFDIAGMELAKANREGTIFTFEDNSNPNGSVYTDFLVQNNIPLKKNTAYQLSFSIRGTGTIITYVYGNNSSGKYIDNGHRWGLTNQWQEFQQYLPPESVPLNANFNFRSATNCSGEVTNLKLTPVE